MGQQAAEYRRARSTERSAAARMMPLRRRPRVRSISVTFGQETPHARSRVLLYVDFIAQATPRRARFSGCIIVYVSLLPSGDEENAKTDDRLRPISA